MNGLNSVAANGEKNEEMATTSNIKVTHWLNEREVAVPSNSSSGDLKSITIEKIGLKPEMHKLSFRGKERDENEGLQAAGLQENSKVLLVEDISYTQKSLEFKETSVIARRSEAVAEVTEEVDKLSEKISALQVAADSGTKVDNQDIIYVTEMLMRQLLKLDGIDAEGEGKVQRKMEVRRIQSFLETMDVLKSRNLNDISVSVTTQWEAFEPDWASTTITSPVLSPPPNQHPPSTPDPTLTPVPIFTSSTSMAVTSSVTTQVPSSTLNPEQFSSPFVAASIPPPVLSPVHSPSLTLTPKQFFAPIPSSTKVTEEWVQFD